MEFFVPIISNPYPHFRNHCCGGIRRSNEYPLVLKRQRVIPRTLPLYFGGCDPMDWVSIADIADAILTSPKTEDSKMKNVAKQMEQAKNHSTTSKSDNNRFEVKFNASKYQPEDLSVKISDGLVIIEGKHEETKNHEDNNAGQEFISRQFKRSIKLPENIIQEQIECKLESNGVLAISAPLKAIEPPKEPVVKNIPINVLPVESGKSEEAVAETENTTEPTENIAETETIENIAETETTENIAETETTKNMDAIAQDKEKELDNGNVENANLSQAA